MSKFLKIAASAILLSGMAVTSAFAGTISNISGDVIVERDGQYLAAVDNTALLTGDKVFATTGATATLTKGNCAIDLTSNNVVSIGEAGDCSTVLLAQATPTSEFALPTAASLNAADLTTGAIVGITAAAAAGIIIITELDDDDQPSSP